MSAYPKRLGGHDGRDGGALHLRHREDAPQRSAPPQMARESRLHAAHRPRARLPHSAGLHQHGLGGIVHPSHLAGGPLRRSKGARRRLDRKHPGSSRGKRARRNAGSSEPQVRARASVDRNASRGCNPRSRSRSTNSTTQTPTAWRRRSSSAWMTVGSSAGVVF